MSVFVFGASTTLHICLYINPWPSPDSAWIRTAWRSAWVSAISTAWEPEISPSSSPNSETTPLYRSCCKMLVSDNMSGFKAVRKKSGKTLVRKKSGKVRKKSGNFVWSQDFFINLGKVRKKSGNFIVS